MEYELLNLLCENTHITITRNSSVVHQHTWNETKTRGADYVMWVVMSGSLELCQDEEVYTLSKYDTFLFFPHKTYTARSLTDTVSFIFTSFSMQFEQFFRPFSEYEFSGHVPAYFIKKESRDWQSFFARPIDVPAYPWERLAHFIPLLCKTITFNTKTKSLSFSKKSSISPEAEKILQYIKDNIDGPLTVKELSRYMNFSENHFAVRFKKIFNQTPHAYILSLKMQKAHTLLAEGDHSVQDIAEMLGFSDQFSFSKAFKKYYSISPSHFRSNTPKTSE